MNIYNFELEDIKKLIRECLIILYHEDSFLFIRNQKKGISERGLVFRFAHNLQNKIDNICDEEREKLYVDCDFNSSFEYIFIMNHFKYGREVARKLKMKMEQKLNDSLILLYIKGIILRKVILFALNSKNGIQTIEIIEIKITIT